MIGIDLVKGGHAIWVEDSAGVSVHDLEDGFEREGASVWAIRTEGVEDIAYRHDS